MVGCKKRKEVVYGLYEPQQMEVLQIYNLDKRIELIIQ